MLDLGELTVTDPLERGVMRRVLLRGVVLVAVSEAARRAAMLTTRSSMLSLSNSFTKASSHT